MRIRPGERVPVDGEIQAGYSAFNESAITGESMPLDKTVGEPVYAGALNGSGVVDVRTTALPQDSTIATIIRLVEEASSAKAPSQQLVDRFAAVYTPIVVALAAVIALAGWAFGDGEMWFYRALVLLVIAVWDQGGTVSWTWLLYPVALLIVLVMSLGIAMVTARLVHAVRDLANLMPLIVRLLRYVSGVFFSIEDRVAAIDGAPSWVSLVMEYQPVAVALSLVREPLMAEYSVQWMTWAVAGGWAILFLVVGFLVFWRAEGTYGRA